MFGNFLIPFFEKCTPFSFCMVNAGIGCDISSQEVHLGLENDQQHTVRDKILILSIANVNL